MSLSVSRLSPHPSPPLARDMSRPQYPSSSTTTPLGHPPWSPVSVGQVAPPKQLLSTSRTPMTTSAAVAAASPSYFGFVVDSNSALPSSTDTSRYRQRVGQTPSSVKAHATSSPKLVSADATSDFEAFRRRSEKGTPFILNGDGLSIYNTTPSTDSANCSPGHPQPYPNIDRARVEPPTPSAFNGSRSSAYGAGPRLQSPAPMTSPSQLSVAEDRNARLSLPTNVMAAPSDSDFSRTHCQRSSTLPTAIDNDGELFIPSQALANAIRTGAPILILDLRASSAFLKGRLRGSIHICLSKVLLKRQSYTADKVADGIQDASQRAKFKSWRTTALTVVYDDRSSTIQEASSLSTMLQKFPSKEREGSALILKGGYDDFSARFPDLIENDASSSVSNFATLSQNSNVANSSVVTGCAMPSADQSQNPLFASLIRQNQDLRDGVGQIPLTLPSRLRSQDISKVPRWLQAAAAAQDQGKNVADKFLKIEKAEQQRMEAALSMQAARSSGSGNTWRIAGMEKGSKNRYNKIWPFDHSRVRLQNKSTSGCDYINANHVKSPLSKRRYIATQGPLPATFDDFWKAVWQQDVRVIIMLTAESEGGQIKCHQYWQGGQFGNLKLRFLAEQRVALDSWKVPGSKKRSSSSPADKPYVVARKFALSNCHEPFTPVREITQLSYTFWPDFGIPTDPGHLLGLVDQCNGIVRAAVSASPSKAEAVNNRPVLVHCSAGCGRTGTFCAVDTVVEMMLRKRDAQYGKAEYEEWMGYDDLDLVEVTVKAFREQRISMVQNLSQYVLVYQCILEWVASMLGE